MSSLTPGEGMPDLDNMAKRVQGSWKSIGVRAALVDARSPGTPAKLGQALAHVLSRCAASYAGVDLLRSMQMQLMSLAAMPMALREQAFRDMQFPAVPEGKEAAFKAARKVGTLICAGQLEASEVTQALARRFLAAIADSEFFGRLTPEDVVKIYGSADAAKASLAQAQGEIAAYVDGTDQEFAESMFERVRPVAKPDLPRLDTAAQMEHDLEINLELLALDDP